jgi:hypothetical protein
MDPITLSLLLAGLVTWGGASPDRAAAGLRGGLAGAGLAGWRHVRSEVRSARSRARARRQTARVARWTRWSEAGPGGRVAVWSEQQARGLGRAVVWSVGWSARAVWSARGPVRQGWSEGRTKGAPGLIDAARARRTAQAEAAGLTVLTPDQAGDPAVWADIDPMTPDARARHTKKWAAIDAANLAAEKVAQGEASRARAARALADPDTDPRDVIRLRLAAGLDDPRYSTTQNAAWSAWWAARAKASGAAPAVTGRTPARGQTQGARAMAQITEYRTVADLVADAKAVEVDATALDDQTAALQKRVCDMADKLTAADWETKPTRETTDHMIGAINVTSRPWQELAQAARAVVLAGQAAQADVGQATQTHGARGDTAAFAER